MTNRHTDFSAVRISLASPEKILEWSSGEVTKPETINYRTLKPERDGLFCERIFGPTKDFECACGKYKKFRFKGIKCERCGVEVTRARVRRERMGHIKLAAPVAHIWFSKGTPSAMGLLLNLTPRNLERVLYFARFIVTGVNEEARARAREALEKARDEALQQIDKKYAESLAALQSALERASEQERPEVERRLEAVQAQMEEEKEALSTATQEQIDELESLQPGVLLVESRYRVLKERFPDVFRAGMGAEAILELLRGINLEQLRLELLKEMESPSSQRRKKAIKRLRVVEAFRRSGNKPEWMILQVLPVLPPDLRPMVQLDGGRFAVSDLNDLYRRVINRNNRLKRLIDLDAPEIIIRNEKRMLQEAVDALIDNSRRGRPQVGARNHRLKSLSDFLRGKQGRFRQNLLGKRVDYSGRSVIVVGPELQLHQCGLPKRMALELFKPFVMHKLIAHGLANNVRSAKRWVEQMRPEVWDILDEVIRDRPVLLNRAPTLHRLGIQAFMPVLIEGSAIQIHPLVCPAYNADFDGDQMAVHVPLSRKAVLEATRLMLSTHNLLSPASGEPIVAPTLDIVLGCYYLTRPPVGEPRPFSSPQEAILAYHLARDNPDPGAQLSLHQAIRLPRSSLGLDADDGDPWLVTTVGRLLFREVLPPQLQRDPSQWNIPHDKGTLRKLVAHCIRTLGSESTVAVLDNLKRLGFHSATLSGITVAISDLEVPVHKRQLLEEAERQVQVLEEQYLQGLITEEERYRDTINVWEKVVAQLNAIVKANLPRLGGFYHMVNSGAKGNLNQVSQMTAIRGLMADPRGRIIEVPVRSSFREGLSVLEYFISTHGARKGLSDTALRTADSGYLTRRMVDVAQEAIILERDCGTEEGFLILREPEKEKQNFIAPFRERIFGRMAAAPVVDPSTGEVIVQRNEEIDEERAERIDRAGITQVWVRSPLTCQLRRGLCQMCYGRQLATGRQVMIGEAVGIMAAQSIGEPGTQLTMRTFHTGGVAGVDITSGIPRVEELFEARIPKNPAILSEMEGVVHLEDTPEGKRIVVVREAESREEYILPPGYQVVVQAGQDVQPDQPLALPSGDDADQPPLKAHLSGRVHLEPGRIVVVWRDREERSYPRDGGPVPATYHIQVKEGDRVKIGDVLAYGPGGPSIKNPHEVLALLGKEESQRYIIEEIQKVYRFQGVSIHDKHLEVILRQMYRKVRVDEPGDTSFLPGDLVDRFAFAEENKRVLAEGGAPATGVPVLMGITRVALLTDSFLAAASFQETTRVLTEAALAGAVDHLHNLKENVIIGRLIPANLERTPEGRAFLGLPAEETPALAPTVSEEEAELSESLRLAMEAPPVSFELPEEKEDEEEGEQEELEEE
ncbi:MAG: DNA-directed RNA polymerase subunit beta' [Chloroflexota bacterium]|nr:DNA-directed RNA polymerase subunit beta' [Chloroflexota bacterium]